ncbi:2756_t:CDS:1, partial [Acaulospora colombiana]
MAEAECDEWQSRTADNRDLTCEINGYIVVAVIGSARSNSSRTPEGNG